MTIPTLITNYHTKLYKTKVQETISMLSQSVKLYYAETGQDFSSATCSGFDTGYFGECVNMVDIITKNLKVAEIITGEEHSEEGTSDYKYSYYGDYLPSSPWSSSYDSRVIYRLTNGINLIFPYGTGNEGRDGETTYRCTKNNNEYKQLDLCSVVVDLSNLKLGKRSVDLSYPGISTNICTTDGDCQFKNLDPVFALYLYDTNVEIAHNSLKNFIQK